MQLKEQFNWFSADRPIYWAMTPVLRYYERMDAIFNPAWAAQYRH